MNDPTFRCGADPHVIGALSPEARAELQDFAEYLKEKARRKKEGLPRLASFDAWRNQRQADGS